MANVQALMKAPAGNSRALKTIFSAGVNKIEQMLGDDSNCNAHKFASMVLQEVADTPKLQQCRAGDIFREALKGAQWGLYVGSALGLAYLVPFNTKSGMRPVLIPGYQGLIDLALRLGIAQKIEARCVHENDTFEYELGLEPRLTHRPAPLTQARGQIIGAYAWALLPDGERIFDVMSKPELDGIKTRAPSGGKGPWDTDYGEMARKTVVRRLFKYMQKQASQSRSDEVERLRDAIERDNQVARGQISSPEPADLESDEEEMEDGAVDAEFDVAGERESIGDELADRLAQRRDQTPPDEPEPEQEEEAAQQEPPDEVHALRPEAWQVSETDPAFETVGLVETASGSFSVLKHQARAEFKCTCHSGRRGGDCGHIKEAVRQLEEKGWL